jgi:hypothetical protein
MMGLKMMTTSSLAMIVAIIQFENQIPVAPVVAPNSLTMISMNNQLHLRVQVAHLHVDPAALQHEGLVVDLEALLAAHLGVQVVTHPEVLLEVQVAALLVRGQVVALQVVALVAALLARVPVAALQVVALVVALLARVPVAVLQVRAPVAHPRERAHLVDYNRIQTPSPASRHPIVNSTFREFSSSFPNRGVPEIMSATKMYHPPSMSMAIHATIVRSPQVKSG